jgi:hypothetical protein
MGGQKDGDRMRVGMLTSAEDMARLRQVNVHWESVPVTMEWLMAEASRQLEGLAHAVPGGASDAIVLTEAADVGNLCQIIGKRSVMP